MAVFRQLLIAAQDPRRLALFCCQVFELEKIDEGQEIVFLSDGVFNPQSFWFSRQEQ